MTMVGVLEETGDGERRVALTPDGVQRLHRLGVEVTVQTGAGRRAWFGDEEYVAAGAATGSREQVYAASDVLVCLDPPADVGEARDGQVLVGLLSPLTDPGLAQRLAVAGVTSVSLDLLPRTLSRAQAMDALTSQANVAGYQAAIVAAEAYGGYFPMLMTAAGTTRPAQVVVLGAGVAGLQAIATARRLGALVTAYDVRDAARADIASTGATVLDLADTRQDRAAEDDGYARELAADEAEAQQRALTAAIPRFDVVITTAQVPGKPPPVLVPADALTAMRPGSVVVDLAAGPYGGNVAGSVPDRRTVTGEGVTVIGAGRLPSTMPQAASTAYARNLIALLAALMPQGAVTLDLGDEIQAAVVVTHGGKVVNPRVRELIDERKEIRS
ncbi:NAD(P) transhydrogenase subunit alpha [Actinoplanes sp. NPDC051411]|uniref:NAD(P) transhydrogenase subunit alpha n=1 Tax=Actinoplanes sp. NPDC051411 TaxID=3155522 RepID=UPI0034423E8C